jgi:hypothetical protein
LWWSLELKSINGDVTGKAVTTLASNSVGPSKVFGKHEGGMYLTVLLHRVVGRNQFLTHKLSPYAALIKSSLYHAPLSHQVLWGFD